jgi:hypothetical protein
VSGYEGYMRLALREHAGLREQKRQSDKERARQIHRTNPDLSYTAIGQRLGRGGTIVAKWIQEDET